METGYRMSMYPDLLAVFQEELESMAAGQFRIRIGHPLVDEPLQASARNAEDNVARIVKETTASLNGMSAKSERAKKQYNGIVHALSECKEQVAGADGAAVRTGKGTL